MKIAPTGAAHACRRVLAVLAGALAAGALLAGCATRGGGPIATPDLLAQAGTSSGDTPSGGTLYVVRRGWHIDIGVDAGVLAGQLVSLRADFPQVRYVLFGFGDRRYLESHRHELPNLLAALWPGDGLLLVTALSGTPEQAFGAQWVARLPVNAAQLRAALGAVSASLSLQGGAVTVDGPGPYAGSEYLRALARYSAMHTCNTWAAEMLQAAGEPVRSRGVLFAGQLWRQVSALPQ